MSPPVIRQSLLMTNTYRSFSEFESFVPDVIEQLKASDEVRLLQFATESWGFAFYG